MIISRLCEGVSLKPAVVVGLVYLFVVLLLILTLPMAQAKRQPKIVNTPEVAQEVLTKTTELPDVSPVVKPLKLTKNQSERKTLSTEAQVTAFELEPPANPDYPTQLCGERRERLVALQTMPWVAKPFFLGERRVEQWQYRLCLSKTMPEVQRYLESFPVPYTPQTP